MKLRLVFLIWLISMDTYGQVVADTAYNQSGAIQLTFSKSQEESVSLAESDIKKGCPFLFIQSGISPVVYSADPKFETHFKGNHSPKHISLGTKAFNTYALSQLTMV